MSGTPMAEESFAAESVTAMARLLSRSLNHRPMALAFAGKVGDSATPRSSLAAKRPTRPVESAAQNDATLHKNVVIRPTRRTPSRSSSKPAGTCIAA